MEANLYRQKGFFDPNILRNPIKVTVVGAGALGSHIVDILASVGIKDITVYDFDTVVEHNIPNQVYKLSDVGRPKVDALVDHVKAKMGYEIRGMNKKLESLKDEGIDDGYLVVATDTMKTNLSLITQAIDSNIQKVVEAKMSVSNGQIFFFEPQDPYQYNQWKHEWRDNVPDGIVACTQRACAVNIHLICSIAAGCIMLDNISEEWREQYPPYHQTEVYVNGSVVRNNWGLDKSIEIEVDA